MSFPAPAMSLETAWTILGEDPVKVMAGISSIQTRPERVRAAEEALEEAKRTAKKLAAVHHPDKNPGDKKAEERYKRVREALAVITFHTERLRKLSDDLDERIANGETRARRLY